MGSEGSRAEKRGRQRRGLRRCGAEGARYKSEQRRQHTKRQWVSQSYATPPPPPEPEGARRRRRVKKRKKIKKVIEKLQQINIFFFRLKIKARLKHVRLQDDIR